MAKFTDKISNLINSQAPEFVVSDHPKFLEFVKSYYTFMESAELAVTSVQTTDGLRLESEIASNEDTLLLDASRIDTANSTITVEADTFVGGSADAGVGYTTASSYST